MKDARPVPDIADVACSPRFSPVYVAFYYLGLEQICGRKIRISPAIGPRSSHSAALAFEIKTSRGRTVRYFADTGDHADLDQAALEWCDAYGKVNLDMTQLPTSYADKLVALGPNFGLRLWGTMDTVIRFALTAPRIGLSPKTLRSQWGGYRWQLNRVEEGRYVPAVSEDGYLFFAAWPWKKHESVNPPRARFIRAAQGVEGLVFEGGFAPRRRHDVQNVLPLSAPRRYPLDYYLDRLGRSVCAFNSPAVHDCLGWKLGEFLALGKAVISLPLTRALPAPLEHGKHLHYVENDEDAMRDAIELLRSNPEYRRELETNARKYYEDYLAPVPATRRLLEHGLQG